MKAFKPINNIRDIRKNLGLNQIEFWSQVGVTQSGGSRYESGRNMPKPVRELLRLVHVEQVDIKSIKTDGAKVIITTAVNSPTGMYWTLTKDRPLTVSNRTPRKACQRGDSRRRKIQPSA